MTEATAEWISAPDACEQYNIQSVIIHQTAKKQGWEVKSGRSKKKGRGHKRVVLFKRKTVEKWCENATNRRYVEARSVVKWVDSLTEWPSDEDINSHSTDTYRYNDIVSVIETRKYRGLTELVTHES